MIEALLTNMLLKCQIMLQGNETQIELYIKHRVNFFLQKGGRNQVNFKVILNQLKLKKGFKAL